MRTVICRTCWSTKGSVDSVPSVNENWAAPEMEDITVGGIRMFSVIAPCPLPLLTLNVFESV